MKLATRSLIYGTTIILSLAAGPAFALEPTDETMIDVLQRLIDTAPFVMIALYAIFGIIGLSLTGFGVKGMVDANDPQKQQTSSTRKSGAQIVGGVILLSLLALIFVLTNTTFGSSDNASDSLYEDSYRDL